MRFSEQWLRSWVNPDVDTQTLVEQLTMAGLEVDETAAAAAEFSGVKVARILSAEAHPDADKLQLCSVDVGEEQPLQIVCGAANARAGLLAPLATVGGRMPGGFKIKKAKLRGVASFGMLCSAKELGLAEESDGLLELPEDAPVGTDLREWMGLDDVCIEVDLTPNRGDCLSVAGVARELGVLNRMAVSELELDAVDVESSRQFPLRVDAVEDCPRYLGRVIEGIDANAKTPWWMQERLRRSGLRSLGPSVDVTNYVLLELGQPMHAFDLAQLEGGVCVRKAASGESLVLLDGKRVSLNPDTLVIADDSGPLALAGIMGGERSGVSENSADLFLECAFFSPLAIAGKARAYGLHTDSSHRFERGVDPQLQRLAMERASGLLLSIVGGKAGPIVELASEGHLPKPTAITLRRERISRVLGIALPDDEVVEILERLGMSVEASKDGWSVMAPSWRFDMAIEADLIEEIGRIYGYERIPNALPTVPMRMPQQVEGHRSRSAVKSMMVERGFQEVITYSFIDAASQQALDPEAEVMRLANPLSADLSVMRSSLLPGLLSCLRYNQNRQVERVRIFEMGMVFSRSGEDLVQTDRLAALAWGPALSPSWNADSQRQVDFYDLKADAEALLGACAGELGFVAPKAEEAPAAMHPGQCAQLRLDGQPIGWLGSLHPALEQSLGVNGRPVLFELDLAALQSVNVPAYASLSKFPSIRRDLAFLVPEETPASELLGACRAAAGTLLKEVVLFDVYQGDKVENGLKSIALGLILQDYSATLTDDAVAEVVISVVQHLADSYSARLRDS